MYTPLQLPFETFLLSIGLYVRSAWRNSRTSSYKRPILSHILTKIEKCKQISVKLLIFEVLYEEMQTSRN